MIIYVFMSFESCSRTQTAMVVITNVTNDAKLGIANHFAEVSVCFTAPTRPKSVLCSTGVLKVVSNTMNSDSFRMSPFWKVSLGIVLQAFVASFRARNKYIRTGRATLIGYKKAR